YIKEFKEIDAINNAKLLKHPGRNHYVIVVNPAMDKFIFNLCKQMDINIANFNLPREFNAFVKLTKKESIKNDAQLRNLLNTIQQKNTPEIAKISYWIRSFSPY